MKSGPRRRLVALAVWVGAIICLPARGGASDAFCDPPSAPLVQTTFADAQSLFYNGCYDRAAALALALRAREPEDLATYELRASALLFQLKSLLGNQTDKDKAFKACVLCPELLTDFLRETAGGQTLARARLQADPGDETTLFLLGKLDLNYVWLQLGSLGKKKGWDEYWEARRSLDAVLKRNPRHVRARVARAWIDYIVDTRMPRGTRWVLGGGSRERALKAAREAAETEADFFTHAEAVFALWEMQVRERRMAEAIEIARGLARDFPHNQQLAAFLEKHDRAVSQRQP